MGAEALEHCFDVYWTNKKGGTGLGLSAARRIVEEHGGAITVVSEEGRGTSFTIYLPLAMELTHSGREGPALEPDVAAGARVPGDGGEGGEGELA
jgi:nitrogen-specific signal transduction histidine kinase